jgi:Protein of unknown function (DUF2009)
MAHNQTIIGSRSKDSIDFAQVFEIGRRYKMLNPGKMRETYGKMMFALMDAGGPLNPIKTVLSLFGDDAEICKDLIDHPSFKKAVLGTTSRQKTDALTSLVSDFPSLDRSVIEISVHSYEDFVALENEHLKPIEVLLESLQTYFDSSNKSAHEISSMTDLTIRAGRNGARLSHSHSSQYQYVFQSLTLWREVLIYLLPIWNTVDKDLLNPDNYYRLADTGQGLNRMQHPPGTQRIISKVLANVQERLKHNWIGSSVIHLGDHNVPNALFFIEKYCSISRILGPIAHTIKFLSENSASSPLERWPPVQDFIKKSYGTVENCKLAILSDFFKHGFDGSGADNYFDAGSCIDGRLTSAWNWSNSIEKKLYFPIFLISGFIGFDGN